MVTQITTPKSIPFIHEWPLIGSIPAFMTRERLEFVLRVAQQGDVYGFHMGPIPMVLFSKAEHVQSILVDHAHDFSKGRLLQKAIGGNGLFMSEGEFHHKQRKLMAPFFQPRHIASYADTIVAYAKRTQQTWLDGTVIDLNQQMIALTMSVIGKVIFDADIFDETDELAAAVGITMANATQKLSSLFTPPPSWPTPRNRRIRKAEQTIRTRIQRMIDEQRTNTVTAEHNDMLSILLNARDENGEAMSDEQLMDECLTLFAAGHETTAAALSWTWYFLCQHPEAYQKLQQEVDTVLQGRTPTYADLASLPYCLQVFKEALRLYPPAAGIVREALHDLIIDDYMIPKGYAILVSPHVMHHKAEYFPDPETFDPERFAPEREKQMPRNAYIPFGAGPRICIGNHFALMEGQLLIATLAQHVRFSLVPGQTIVADPYHNLATRPGGEVLARVTKL